MGVALKTALSKSPHGLLVPCSKSLVCHNAACPANVGLWCHSGGSCSPVHRIEFLRVHTNACGFFSLLFHLLAAFMTHWGSVIHTYEGIGTLWTYWPSIPTLNTCLPSEWINEWVRKNKKKFQILKGTNNSLLIFYLMFYWGTVNVTSSCE